MLAKLKTYSLVGIDALPVEVEVDVSPRALPKVVLVGLPEQAVKESIHRIERAIVNSGFVLPSHRIVINLAPADQPKQAASFDLPIALGLLAASGQIAPDLLDQYAIVGELALDGTMRPVKGALSMAMAAKAESDAGFAEKAFDEFHLYTLGRRTTLPNNSTKQIELFDQAKQVPAKRMLVLSNGPQWFGNGRYEDPNFPGGGENKVDTYLEFRNDKASGLGVPLPAGRIRVSRLDAADGSLEFIGEDAIGHTPRDERVRVKLGSAFDVVGERKQVDFRIDSRARFIEEEIEVELRNHKDEEVEVQVREFLYRWSNWNMLSSSQPFTKEDARTAVFTVKVPKNANRTVRYRVRYSW